MATHLPRPLSAPAPVRGMDREALRGAVEQLLYVIGRTASDTQSVVLEPGGVTWSGREGECIVTREWHGVLPDLLDWTVS